ncbi:MAG: PilW family protein [Pseudomonadota bacterium]|nr:PilW family protein [Pseudomonadota bacterium]
MMHLSNRKIPGACRNAQGFSLVELMVALVISLILLGGVSQIFLSSKKSFTIQDSLGRQQENGRYAIDTITADLRRAGYWGGNAQIEDISGSLGTVDDNGSCPTDTTWGRMIDRRVTGLNDTSAGYVCIPTAGPTGKYLRGDVLTVRYTAPWIIGGASTPVFEANRLYLRSSLFRGRIFQGSGEGDSENAISTPPSLTERESELIARAYYIGDSGRRCDNGDVIPSLFRQTLGPNGTPIAEEIAYGVDHFQVRYGVDTDGDASVDQYFDAGDANLSTTAQWGSVIAARVWVLTRAECPETGFNHTGGAYTMGVFNYTPADTADFGYRRQLYQSTVQLRN